MCHVYTDVGKLAAAVLGKVTMHCVRDKVFVVARRVTSGVCERLES